MYEMMNNFYFDKDAAPMLMEAGFDCLYFTRDLVRIETHESPHWFYHICAYIGALGYEEEFLEERGLLDEED
jgi:hypothetical protein